MRNYPQGRVTSDVIGYVGRINPYESRQINSENYSATTMIGKTGVEKQFEQQLHGSVGNQTAETDASGRVVRQLNTSGAKPGEDLYLTIDSRLQKIALDALGSHAGAVVAVQPGTGQILALVSNPTYNANQFVTGINEHDYQQLLQAPDHPLINRAIHGVFAAASTAKPFYALEGYNSGLLATTDSIFDPGWFRIKGTHHIYHDWQPAGHGWVNARKAIAVSCDTFFYHLAFKLGLHRLDDILTQFGFGKPTGIDLPSEAGGLVPTPEWKMASQGHPWYSGDTVVAGIGQGYVLVTPLQLAMATATLGERGKRFKPQLILKTSTPNQAVPKQINSIALPPVSMKAPWMWDTVIGGMHDVITKPYGTGLHFGRNTTYSVAAKTGTAQVYGHTRDEYKVRTNIPKRLRNDSLFIAFSPVEHPEIAIAVIVEHDASAPQISRKILDAYYQLKRAA
jgi:penicillin-binding protein 2